MRGLFETVRIDSRRALLLCPWTHPEITHLGQLHRERAEESLGWLGAQTSQHTGAPLAMTTRRSVVTLLARFVNETAVTPTSMGTHGCGSPPARATPSAASRCTPTPPTSCNP